MWLPEPDENVDGDGDTFAYLATNNTDNIIIQSVNDKVTGKKYQEVNISSDTPGFDIIIDFSSMDITELWTTYHLQYEFRKSNLPDTTGLNKREIEQRFCRSVLSYIYPTLQNVGIDHDELQQVMESEDKLSWDWLYTIFLKRIRKSTMDDIVDHFDKYPEIWENIGLDNMSSSTLSRRQSNLFENTNIETEIEKASLQIMFGAYRAGIPIPKKVEKNHEKRGSKLSPINIKKKAHEGEYPSPTLRRLAIRDWADTFLNYCVPSIGLDRAENKRYSLAAIYGLFAHAAQERAAISGGQKTSSGWLTGSESRLLEGASVQEHSLNISEIEDILIDDGPLPTQGGVSSQIESLGINEIQDMFLKANNILLQLGIDSGVINQSARLACDTTSKYTYSQETNLDEWTKGHGESYKGSLEAPYADYKWEFGLLSMIDSNTEYLLGMYPIGKDVGTSDATDRLLQRTVEESPIDVKRVYMDRGFYSSAVVSSLRGNVGEDWIILGKREHRVKDLIEKAPDDEPSIYPMEDVLEKLNERPNVVLAPISPKESETTESLRPFITDMSKKEIIKAIEELENEVEDEEDEASDNIENKIDVEKINQEYKKRRRIESTIGQVKSYCAPPSNSPSTKVRYFYFNLGLLFYNMHELMNSGLSPRYAIPLGKSIDDDLRHKEVLNGIKHVAFERLL